MTLLNLFLSFLQIGLFSVGGGYAAIPLIENQIVKTYGWLSMNEFTDLITIAEMTPGPVAINSATFVGLRVAGFGGAVLATFGCILPSMVLVSVMAKVYLRYRKGSMLSGVLSCLRPAVVALIASAGLSILKMAVFAGGALSLSTLNVPCAVLFGGALFALRKWKVNPILVMSLCGALYLIFQLLTGAV